MRLLNKNIIWILITACVIGFVYNYYNPNELKIIRGERILNWESDSAFIDTKINPTAIDSINLNRVDNQNDQKSFGKPKAINIDFAYTLFKQGIKFIDARSPEEFEEGHIKGAINIPFYGSENYLNVISKLNKNEVHVTYCSSSECDVSTLSGDELFEMGLNRVYIFIGGYDEWIKNNYPIITKIN
jgi:rhodanese-related sulfurtransferase